MVSCTTTATDVATGRAFRAPTAGAHHLSLHSHGEVPLFVFLASANWLSQERRAYEALTGQRPAPSMHPVLRPTHGRPEGKHSILWLCVFQAAQGSLPGGGTPRPAHHPPWPTPRRLRLPPTGWPGWVRPMAGIFYNLKGAVWGDVQACSERKQPLNCCGGPFNCPVGLCCFLVVVVVLCLGGKVFYHTF